MIVAFAAVVLFSYVGWTLGATPVATLVAIIFVMPLIAWFVFRGHQIFCSVRRFNLCGKTKAT
jgi:hypothetical protein